MKHFIDPTVDCVFKKLLGSEENKNLLIHFLNAVIQPYRKRAVTDVELLNPWNEKEFSSDKLSSVDVKAKDDAERGFHVDIQISVHAGLFSRMLYYWSVMYASQLFEVDDYSKLKPAIAIWIVTEKVFAKSKGFHYHFSPHDPAHNLTLNDDLSIHVLSLQKFKPAAIETELERWLAFFKDGKRLDVGAPPDYLNTREMRQAMKTLQVFSEKEREFHLYQSRLDARRVQMTIENENKRLKQMFAEAQCENARINKEKAKAQKEAARAQREKEALLKKLKELGVDAP